MRTTGMRGWLIGATLGASATLAPALELGPPAVPAEALDEAGARTVDARLWVGRGGTRFGAGVGLTRPVWALDGDASRRSVVLGVHHAFDSRSGVYADAQQFRTDGLDGRLRVGLEFKNAPSQFAGLRSGSLLRIQLSSDSNLSLRPRRGGLLVTYRAQW